MAEKKYKKEDIIRSIEKVFESVEKYADYKKKARQTIYSRINTQTPKFINELESDGISVVTQEISLEAFNTLDKKVNDLMKLVVNLSKENVDLRKENIELHKKNNNLSVEVATLGGMLGGKSEMNG